MTPTAVVKWEKEGFKYDQWADLFNMPYRCTRSTKLQSFQFQIIHRYIPTRKFLFVRDIIDSPKCTRCHEIDTMMHHFVTCRKLSAFWKTVKSHINACHSEPLNPNKYDLLFGIPSAPPLVNLILILARHYIHACNRQEKAMTFGAFWAYVTDVYRTEEQAAERSAERRLLFLEKWNMFCGTV